MTQYLDFLRYSLHDDLPLPESAGEIDWMEMLCFARKQCVVGVMFRGIRRLTADTPHPNARQLAQWGAEAALIADDNRTVFQDAFKATNIIYRQYGHRGCVLKGQGNALMYPDPFARESGDIDLWIAPNKGETTDDLMRLCRTVTPGCDVEYHHSDNDNLTSTPVELHFRPSFDENMHYNRRLQQYFETNREKQFVNVVVLPDRLGKICVPTDSFNRVFQLSHLKKHFVSEGIGLRHFVDYFYLLRRGATEDEKAEFARTAKWLGLWKFARGTMAVMHDVLGLEKEFLLAEPDHRLGRAMTREILKSGNFGHDDERYNQHAEYTNSAQTALASVMRTLRVLPMFPLTPLFHTIWILNWHFIGKRHVSKVLAGK